MSYFAEAFAKLRLIEGGHVNDPRDPGGDTAAGGLTEKVARAYGYRGPMSSMPAAEVERIAKAEYWDMLRLDEIAAISEDVAFELLESNYNMGGSIVGRNFQYALNALNKGGTLYPDLEVDGHIGPRTVQAFATLLRNRKSDGETVMLRALNSLQCVRYLGGKEDYVFGWILNRVRLEQAMARLQPGR